MIKVNGKKVELKRFPDGTLMPQFNIQTVPSFIYDIEWYYESDTEFIALSIIKKYVEGKSTAVNLAMPYIPNGRMDRVKNDDEIFTLKYFAQMINDLEFDTVCIFDPHSYVSEALIDNVVVFDNHQLLEKVTDDITHNYGLIDSIFYPDNGAAKRYSENNKLPYTFGVKKRDWKTGQIEDLQVIGDESLIRGKNMLIVDDICSRGGTFLYSARKLKKLGAANIYLCVSHCENTILEGELINSGLLAGIYTTDSIFTKKHDLITVIPINEIMYW